MPYRCGGARSASGHRMYTLYSDQRSGNSYKVRLALARLGIPFTLVEIDILQGASRTPEFLAKNPNGHVPLLEVAPNRYLAESNAILWYVAGGTTLAPEDRIDRAEAHAMDVLRAAQPGAQYRRRLFLAGAGQRRPRPAAARARGLDGKRLSRARRHGDAPRRPAGFSPPTASPSPTSRSTPTPTWRTAAISISRAFRRCAPGSTAWRPSPAT